jgi:hypothetical protein
MLNNAKATSTLNEKTNADQKDAAISTQQSAEQHDRKDHNDAKLGVAKGLLECCRKRGVSVTACGGTFK